MADIISGYPGEKTPYPDTLPKPKELLVLNLRDLTRDTDTRRLYLSTSENEDQIENLAVGVVNLLNLTVANNADTLVLMDKSARPIGHLFINVWRELYPDSKRPEIRFINVGTEGMSKDDNRTFLKELHDAHFKSMDGKVVILADEAVHTGNSIKRAKNLVEKVFPKTKKVIYTAVCRETPVWYGSVSRLGVYDLRDLPSSPHYGEPDYRALRKSEPDKHVSKTLAGVLRRNPKIIAISREILEDRRANVNDLRGELSYLAKKIAGSCMKVPREQLNPQPILSEYLNEILNKNE